MLKLEVPATIIIPILNEEDEIVACLEDLQKFRAHGFEVIVIDGHSNDRTRQLSQGKCEYISTSQASRARQMNTGALHARGNIIIFLHVDTRLPENLVQLISELPKNTPVWGRFDIILTGKHWMFRVIAAMINLRSRLTGICTGDQAIFMSKPLFYEVSGFPLIALMEDIAMSKKLKPICPPICFKHKVISSSRRWEKHGIIKTIMKMWYLRAVYFMGVHPDTIARQYD